jgi:hypothetical protein
MAVQPLSDTSLPVTSRICATCHFWGQDLSVDAMAPGQWMGLCARKDCRSRSTEWCPMWSPPYT